MADIILVMLGTNDYSTLPHPRDQEFLDGYTDFVRRIQCDYPSASIILLSPPGLADTKKMNNIAKAADVTNVHFLNIDQPFPLHGCESHPNEEEQIIMAKEYVIPFVQELLGL